MEREQRWREGATRWVKPDRPYFDPEWYEVRSIQWKRAVAFVTAHHYSRTYPSIVLRHGLFDRRRSPARLVGVATYGQPGGPSVLKKWIPGRPGLELNRFVLLDEVLFNAETWFLGKSFALLKHQRPDLRGVIAMSDPHPRTSLSGEIVMPGHVGQIYQGHNARLMGRSSAQTLFLDEDGRSISPRSASKLDKERGGEGFYKRFLEAGAPRRRAGEGATAYVSRALREGPFRPMEHPGNYVYLWDRFGPKREQLWIAKLRDGVERLRLEAVFGASERSLRLLSEDLGVPRWMIDRLIEERGAGSDLSGPNAFDLVELPYPGRGPGRAQGVRTKIESVEI